MKIILVHWNKKELKFVVATAYELLKNNEFKRKVLKK